MNISTAAFLIIVLAITTGASETPTTKKAGSAAAASKKKGLSPAAEKFIRSIGLDPRSPDVKLAISDGTIKTLRAADEPASYSLESLAMEKNKTGAIKFIKARVLLHKIETEPAGVPRNERGGIDELEMLYLTLKERRLVFDFVDSKPN